MRYIIATTNLKKNKDPKDPLGEKIFLRTPPPQKKKDTRLKPLHRWNHTGKPLGHPHRFPTQ